MDFYYKSCKEFCDLVKLVFQKVKQDYEEECKVFTTVSKVNEVEAELIKRMEETLENSKNFNLSIEQSFAMHENFSKKEVDLIEKVNFFKSCLENKSNQNEIIFEQNQLNSKILGFEARSNDSTFTIQLHDQKEIILSKCLNSNICISLPATWDNLEDLNSSADLSFVLAEIIKKQTCCK